MIIIYYIYKLPVAYPEFSLGKPFHRQVAGGRGFGRKALWENFCKYIRKIFKTWLNFP